MTKNSKNKNRKRKEKKPCAMSENRYIFPRHRKVRPPLEKPVRNLNLIYREDVHRDGGKIQKRK